MTMDRSRPTPGSAAGEHLDELTLLLMADGEPVEASQAAHAEACPLCRGRLAALRADAATLTHSLRLTPNELAFLFAAALPERLAAQVVPSRVREGSLRALLWWIFPFAFGYAGWLLTEPFAAQMLDFARQAGGTTIALSFLTEAALAVAGTFASVVEGASTVPGFNAPLVTLSALAGLTWLLLLVAPRRTLSAA
jgi:hypothetical protein